MAEPLTWQEARQRGSAETSIKDEVFTVVVMTIAMGESKDPSFPSPETYWHAVLLYLDTNRRRSPTRPQVQHSLPLCTLSECDQFRWECFQSVHSQRENVQGASLSLWWIVLDWSLHAVIAWCTFDLLKPSLNSRRWVKPTGAIIFFLQYKYHASLETSRQERHWQKHLWSDSSLGIGL